MTSSELSQALPGAPIRLDLMQLLERIATADMLVTARCASCGEFRIAYSTGGTLITHGRIRVDQPIELVVSALDYLFDIDAQELCEEIYVVILTEGDCINGTDGCVDSIGPKYLL